MRRAMAPWPPTYSDMSMRTIELLLVAEEPLGEGLGELRLADARGAEEKERAGRLPGVAEPRPRPQHRVRDGAHPIPLAELVRITDIWVDTALQLEARHLRTMERLVRAQQRLQPTAAGVERTAVGG